MDNKKIFAITFIMMFSIFLVSASGVATFKKDQQSDLFQICDDCTYVNLTSIVLPDKQIVSVNELMTKDFNTFNYTYTFSQIGDGNYNVCGDKGGTLKCEAIPYTVTGSGITDTIGFYIVVIILSLGLVILGYGIKDIWVVILGSFGLFLLGLYILFFGIAGMEDGIYTWGLGIITLMLGAYFGTKAGMENLDL